VPDESSSTLYLSIAKENGGVPIHMIWTDTPCRITCLEPRQLDDRSLQGPEHRVHRRTASLARRTNASTLTSFCRPTPPWRWRTSSPPPDRPALRERLHPGAVHPTYRRVEERLRDRGRYRREGGQGQEFTGGMSTRTCRSWCSTAIATWRSSPPGKTSWTRSTTSTLPPTTGRTIRRVPQVL